MANPTTPVTPRVRQLCLDLPCRTNRSIDSGYGSIEASPVREDTKRRSGRTSISLDSKLDSLTLNSYDGNSSEESGSDTSSNYDLQSDMHCSPSLGREKSVTLPRVSRRRISWTDSYPLFSDRRGSHYRHGSDNTGIQGYRDNSMRLLDRFVPLRDHATPQSEKLQTTKPLDLLTPSERLVRHNKDAPDPFYFKRRALPPSPAEARRARRLNQNRTAIGLVPHNQGDRRVSHISYQKIQHPSSLLLEAIPLHIQTILFGYTRTDLDHMQASNSVWSVGGMVSNQGAVDDGRGNLFTSGTNAPMFNTLFPPSKPKAREDVEKHEARLASAFEID